MLFCLNIVLKIIEFFQYSTVAFIFILIDLLHEPAVEKGLWTIESKNTEAETAVAPITEFWEILLGSISETSSNWELNRLKSLPHILYKTELAIESNQYNNLNKY